MRSGVEDSTPWTSSADDGGATGGGRGSRTIRNVFSNWGAFLFHALTGFFVSPFVVNSLGNEVYGTWALLGSMVGYLGLLDLGVRGAVTRFVSNFQASGDHETAQDFSSAALVVFSVTSVVAITAGIVIAVFLDRFSIPDSLLGPARIAVILSAMSIAVAFVTGVYGGIVTAMERFDLSSGTDVGVEAVRLVVLILALRAGHGLVALAAIQLGAGALRLGVSYVISRRIYPEVRPTLARWKRSHLGEIFDFSLTSTGLNGAGIIILQMDAVVIGWFLPVAQVTFFAIAGNLARYARSTVSAISHTITPRISALEGAGSTEATRRVPVVASRVATLVLLPIVLTFVLRGETFVGLWMGPEYAQASGTILLILSLPLWMDAGRQVMASALMGMNRHKSLLLPYGAEAAANLAMSVSLVGSMGIQGVAWGTAVPRVLVSALVLPYVFRRVLGIRVALFWKEAWLRPALAMTPFAGATWAMERITSPGSLAVFFLQVAVVLPAAAVGAWWVGMEAGERRRARTHLASRFPRSSR